MASPEILLKVATILVDAYVNTPVSAGTIKIYMAALADIPDDDLLAAVADHVAHEPKFPEICELRRLALAGRYPDPWDAWGEVKRGINVFHRDGNPEFSHPLIARAVDALGWRTMCDSPIDDEAITRAHFTRAYRSLVDRETFDLTAFTGALRQLPAEQEQNG